MTLLPGAKLAQYEVVSAIGAGGMGEVYRAHDTRLDRDVAVKVMAEHIAADPEMRRRFETEARSVAALSHPVILSIFDLAIVDGMMVVVTELLHGRTLRERLQQGPFAWRDAVRIAAAIADGLAAAHAKGVIHRDLKPENVFLTGDGAVKILDFGLALQRVAPAGGAGPTGDPTSPLTSAGVVLGTFGYMSPEQVLGERVDGRSDIFALGCILYEMLSGRRLFGGTPQEIVANLMHDSAPDLSAFDPMAPQELRAIVGRSIDRDRDRRFGSAGDVAMALGALLTGSTAGAAARRPRPRGKSLAVLPFVNAGADQQIEYITDGITESVINSLSQLDGLRVVPRSLVFRYKGLQADPATVGLALNARTILTGRVVQQGDLLNIQAELVDTSTESQLWGDQFRQKSSELMTVQADIAWQISEALRLKLTGEQKKKLRKRTTVVPEAYQEYLRGRYHWHRWTPEGFHRALEHYERAISLDPTFAQAYAGLGDTFGAMSYYGFIAPAEGFPRARAAATRALEIDRDLPDAHVTLAVDRLFYGWDWPAAEREYRKAIELSPSLALAHSLFGLWYTTCGRHEESLAEARAARDLDPLSIVINMSVAWSRFFAGDYDEAIREATKTRELAVNLHEAGNILISSYEETGRLEEAARLIGQQPCWGIQFDGQSLLDALQAGGPTGYWRRRRAMLEEAEPSAGPIVDVALSMVHAKLGETDLALDRLDRMMAAHLPNAVFLAVDPALKTLAGHPRYEAMIKKLAIPLRQTDSAPRTASP